MDAAIAAIAQEHGLSVRHAAAHTARYVVVVVGGSAGGGGSSGGQGAAGSRHCQRRLRPLSLVVVNRVFLASHDRLEAGHELGGLLFCNTVVRREVVKNNPPRRHLLEAARAMRACEERTHAMHFSEVPRHD